MLDTMARQREYSDYTRIAIELAQISPSTVSGTSRLVPRLASRRTTA
jgi:hypothetical protein